MDNEQRADLGLVAVRAAATREGEWRNLDPRTALSHVLADIAHLCDRLGLDPGVEFDHALNIHQGDSQGEESAKVLEQAVRDREQRLDGSSLATYFDQWPLSEPALNPDPADTQLVLRHPDYANEYYGGQNNDVVEIDFGSEFDGKHGFVMLGAERCNEILAEWREHLAEFPAGREAHQVLKAVIAEYEAASFEEWGDQITVDRDVTVIERAQKVLDRLNAGALPSEAVAAEGFGDDEVYSEDNSIFELDDPDNDMIDFGRSPEGEAILLKRSAADRDTWVLEQRIEHPARDADQHVGQETNKVRAMTDSERKEYSGWATYETWAAGMYLDGNYSGESLYRDVQAATTRLAGGLDESSTPEEIIAVRDELAERLRGGFIEMEVLDPAPNDETFEQQLAKHALGEINWLELADAQLSAVEIEVPKAERAPAEFEPNTTPSATSIVNKALSGHYHGPAVVAEVQQRVRHAAGQDAEYPAIRAADVLKDYVGEIREYEGGASLTDDLVSAQLSDVDWLALAKQRLPEPPAPAGSESPTCRPARDTGNGTDQDIGR